MMILSRVIEHVKKQHWTAVFLDFIIVVAGILIAFQITEWNQDRKDRALEHEYLERLYADIEDTFASRQNAMEWDNTRLKQQALVLKALRSGVFPENDRQDFETGLALFGFVAGLDIRWATVDELRSTGAMNIIRDVSLRSLILQTDANLKRRQGIAANFSGSIYAHRQEIGDLYSVVGFTGERNPVKLSYDFEALAADPEFINALSQIDFLSRFKLDILQDQLDDIGELKDELAKRLELNRDKAL